MTKNLVTFIKGPLRSWVEKNANAQGLTKFWLIPCDKQSPEFDALCQEGERIFSSSEWSGVEQIDDSALNVLSVEGKSIYCFYAPGTQSELDAAAVSACGLDEIELHFLQKVSFLINNDIPATKSIPRQIVEGTAFEADLEEYLPTIFSFALQGNIGQEPLLVSYIRTTLSVVGDGSPGFLFRESLIELALSIPEEDHEWLHCQLIVLARIKRYDNFYLELYKFLEFFFPIANISGLKSAISYSGSALELLEKCKDQLSWNVNHNFGIRAASRYAGIAFAETLYEKTLTLTQEMTREERDKKIDSFKGRAMEAFAELRHSLTHQNFKRVDIDRAKIILSTRALLLFLIEAFGTYKQEIVGVP